MSILHDEHWAKWRTSIEQPMDANWIRNNTNNFNKLKQVFNELSKVICHKGIIYFKNRSDLETEIAEWNEHGEFPPEGDEDKDNVDRVTLLRYVNESNWREIELDEITEETVNGNTVYHVVYEAFNDVWSFIYIERIKEVYTKYTLDHMSST